MTSRKWVVWSWDDRNRLWMEVAEGTEKVMYETLDRQRSAAARLMPGAAWFTMTPKGSPPLYGPAGED